MGAVEQSDCLTNLFPKQIEDNSFSVGREKH